MAVATLLDGKHVAKQLQNQLDVSTGLGAKVPGLSIILVGANEASLVYVRKKQQMCKELKFYSEVHKFSVETKTEAIIKQIIICNERPYIHGILVQLPLPKQIQADERKILETILPSKDVDGLTFTTMGALVLRQPQSRPCTPWGIIQLLKYYDIDFKGKHAVVVGASNIVGRPMVLELLLAGCTISCCHRFTRPEDLKNLVKSADILISAIGKRGIVQTCWLKHDAVVVDVGMIRCEDGKLRGDIDFETAQHRVKYITPVPGGVGPMTVITLMQNTYYNFVQSEQQMSFPQSSERWNSRINYVT